MEEKVEKIYKLVIALIVLVLINIVVTFIVVPKTKVESNNNKVENKQETKENSDYDVSMFDTITIDDALKLFEDKKKNYVVYLGRSTCSACKTFLPTLQATQKKYGYTTKYIDITKVDANSESYTKFIKLLDKKVTVNVSGEKQTKPFGEFFGYTPMTFVIKNGKFSNGIVGAYSQDKFEEFLNNNGIK